MPEYRQSYRTLELYPDGSVRPSIHIVLDPEETDKARHGFFCWHCGEDWSGSDIPAWPGQCPVCQAVITSEEFAQLYRDYESGSQIDWDEEEERLDRQGWERDRELGITVPGIWIPGSN